MPRSYFGEGNGLTDWDGCMAEALQRATARRLRAAERASGTVPSSPSRFGDRRSCITAGANRFWPGRCASGADKIAVDLGDQVLAAEALNALAGFDLESGSMHSAKENFQEALQAGRIERSSAGPHRAEPRHSGQRPGRRRRRRIGALPAVASLLREHRRTTAAAPLPITTWGW